MYCHLSSLANPELFQVANPNGVALGNYYLKIPTSVAIMSPARNTQKIALTASTGTSSAETSLKSSLAGFLVRYRRGVAAANNKANKRMTNKTGAHARL